MLPRSESICVHPSIFCTFQLTQITKLIYPRNNKKKEQEDEVTKLLTAVTHAATVEWCSAADTKIHNSQIPKEPLVRRRGGEEIYPCWSTTGDGRDPVATETRENHRRRVRRKER